tara:strand:- start:206 stop:466 length:261 start_codon:yes stop_codon:yes gene_type:complete
VYVVLNKYKGLLETENLFVYWGKHYIMILIAKYLLIGVVVGLLMELVIRWTNNKIKPLERVYLIIGWPFMAIIFIYNFIKGMKGRD